MPLRGGGGGPLMANAILDFHFDYLNPSLSWPLVKAITQQWIYTSFVSDTSHFFLMIPWLLDVNAIFNWLCLHLLCAAGQTVSAWIWCVRWSKRCVYARNLHMYQHVTDTHLWTLTNSHDHNNSTWFTLTTLSTTPKKSSFASIRFWIDLETRIL